LGTALTAILAVPIGIICFDRGISIPTALGIVFVLIGAYLLVR
jgi:uncharacterized membrane protein